MKLQNSLYTILNTEMKDAAVCYNILLDKSHFIYKAHFPGEPITPGVCLIQIAKELTGTYRQQTYNIQTIKNVKFLAVVSPTLTPNVTYMLEKIAVDEETGDCKVQAVVTDTVTGTTLAKISMTLKPIN